MHNGDLGALTVQINDGIHIWRNVFARNPLILAIDGVMQRPVKVAHHTESRTHAEAVEVTGIAVANRLTILHDGTTTQHPRVVVNVRHGVGKLQVFGSDEGDPGLY